MPLPYIIELTSKSVGGIKGSSHVYGKSNAILGYSFEHRVHVPSDLPEGGEAGLRFHDPLTICKEIDRTTPLLYQHLISDGLFSEIILRFYKADPRGKEINYHTLVLNEAIITDISPEMKITFLEENDPFRDMEYVSFAYKSIRWIDELGLTETSDSTQLLHDPLEECELLSGGVIASTTEESVALNFMFVDHDTMEAVRGVKAQITYPNGNTQHVLSSENGCLSMQDVEKGNYSLSGFNDKPPAAWPRKLLLPDKNHPTHVKRYCKDKTVASNRGTKSPSLCIQALLQYQRASGEKGGPVQAMWRRAMVFRWKSWPFLIGAQKKNKKSLNSKR